MSILIKNKYFINSSKLSRYENLFRIRSIYKYYRARDMSLDTSTCLNYALFCVFPFIHCLCFAMCPVNFIQQMSYWNEWGRQRVYFCGRFMRSSEPSEIFLSSTYENRTREHGWRVSFLFGRVVAPSQIRVSAPILRMSTYTFWKQLWNPEL